MKPLYIPKLGEIVTLAQPWTFQLFNESRNETMMRLQGDTRPMGYNFSYGNRPMMHGISVTLPVGGQLRFDRYYIRKGLKDFDSVTFFYVGQRAAMPGTKWDGKTRALVPFTKNAAVRFWAKLDDVNTMVIV